MVKRKISDNVQHPIKRTTNCLEYIGENGADVIKSFLDLRSRLSFNKICKSQYKPDKDVVMLKRLFETGLFKHPTIMKTINQNFDKVIKTMIAIFSSDQVITDEGSWLPKPHMVVSSTINDDYNIFLHSKEESDIVSFDFSSSYWEQLCFEWSDMGGNVNSISSSFCGYPLTIQTSSEEDHNNNPEGLFISVPPEATGMFGGMFFTQEDLQLHIFNPCFSETDFLEKYPNGIAREETDESEIDDNDSCSISSDVD
jgi:hypothetical protein